MYDTDPTQAQANPSYSFTGTEIFLRPSYAIYLPQVGSRSSQSSRLSSTCEGTGTVPSPLPDLVGAWNGEWFSMCYLTFYRRPSRNSSRNLSIAQTRAPVRTGNRGRKATEKYCLLSRRQVEAPVPRHEGRELHPSPPRLQPPGAFYFFDPRMFPLLQFGLQL